jgi:hypothetical protein
MPIAIACPHCDWKGRVKDELAGKTGKCPTCGELVPIPAAKAKGAPPPFPGAKKSTLVDDEPDVIDDADIVEDAEVVDDRPRPKPRPSGGRSVGDARSSMGKGRKRDDDDDDRPSKSRRRPADDDDEDERPAKSRRRPVDDDEDDERPAKSRRRSDDDDDERPAKSRRRPTDDDDDEPRPRKRRAVADDDDDDDEPRPRKRKKKHARPESRNTKRIGAVIFGLFAVILGGAWLAWIFLGDGRFRPIGPIILTIVGLIAMVQGFTGIGMNSTSDDEDDE